MIVVKASRIEGQIAQLSLIHGLEGRVRKRVSTVALPFHLSLARVMAHLAILVAVR